MGEVYKARDTRLHRTVAIKVLPEQLASDPHLRERLEREARAVAALNHPHICTLHDVGHQDGTDFLVMEYLEGETLADRLLRGALALDQSLQHAIHIADALDKAHLAGITHRDLKPGNIMLTKSGAKLLDFGLAKLRPESSAMTTERNGISTIGPLTGQGSILGTLQYMAPEQLEGRDADARTDIFAFGAVVHEMLTGKKAFEGKTQAAVIHSIMGVDPAPISQTGAMSPPALEWTVRRCLAKHPEDRWQSAADLCQELKWISETVARVVPPALASHVMRASVGWVAAAVLLAALLAVIVAGRLRADAVGVQLGPLKVAVFYPDPSRTGPAYEDGAIQQSGFQTAYDEFAQRSSTAQKPAWNPYLLPQDNGNTSLRDDLLPRIQRLYADGYRVFVLTMSAAVQDVRPVFESWRRQLPEGKAPILICTVASAPGIASRTDGILRFYVRSEEEAGELARYAAWKQGLRRLGVFYVTESAERPNAYGYGGFTTVSHVFARDLHGTIDPHPVFASGVNATAEVAKFIAGAQGRDVGAFIIGYDTMLKETLKALIAGGFGGPILTTSTLTEPLWQPDDRSRDSMIHTVIPHRDEMEGRPVAENGVVYLFSKLTLASTLKCASANSDVRAFVDCWERDTADAGGIMGVNHLNDGDTVIPLTVTNQWRTRTNR
jgi:predicted Ser/Thr protein kinase